MNYYLKEIVSNELRLPTGRVAQFEHVGNDYGILETGDADLIKTMEAYIEAGRGGVTRIDEEQYKEMLKKKLESPSPQEPPRRMSDPPQYPDLVAVDRARAAVVEGLVKDESRSSTTLKLPGFSGAAPEGAKQAGPPPSVPSGDAKVNRPTPKKLVPPIPPPE